MTKPKTLDQLQAEKEQAETQLAQEQHKVRVTDFDKEAGLVFNQPPPPTKKRGGGCER